MVDPIKDAEHRCDALTHDTIQRLHRTFVTPFDREDLYALATSLDDVMDAIDHAAAARAASTTSSGSGPGARELAHTVTASADRLHAALDALAAKKPVHPHAVEINRLENEADRVYQEAVRSLFDDETRSDHDHQVERALRHARGDHRLLRGRRERHRRRRGQARMRGAVHLIFSAIGLIIVVALVFDYINGFHDAANSIATVVSTRVLSPGTGRRSGPPSSTSPPRPSWAPRWPRRWARAWSTWRSSPIRSSSPAWLGAIIWNLITWYFGLPTSSSHALFGGYAGAAVAKAGFGAIIVVGLDEDADLHRASRR